MSDSDEDFELNLTKKSKKKKKEKKEKKQDEAPAPEPAPVEDAKAAQEARLAKLASGPAPPVAEDGLALQDEKTVDVEQLNPLTPEVISRQATINIGTIGHVAHGKSTVVKAISGVTTQRFLGELTRNITIKLGYANAKIYKCTDPKCPRPDCYASYGSAQIDCPPCKREGCTGTMQLLRHVSFVDCPGHDILMATMLNGAAVMDAALLLIAGNEPCPQPQTSEHLAAVEIMQLKNIIILQNKIDLVKESAATEQHGAILDFIQGTVAEGSPIVPISAQLATTNAASYNIDVVCEYIVKRVPIPIRSFSGPPTMIVIRSFDVNKPGTEVDDLQGGVAGGSILRGVLKMNDVIEIRPGIIEKDGESFKCRPIVSRVRQLRAENNELRYAVPGGLIGVGTTVDPTLCRADRLIGQVLGTSGNLPEVYEHLEVKYFLLRRLLGVKSGDAAEGGKSKGSKVQKIAKDEILMVNIGSTSCGAQVKKRTKRDFGDGKGEVSVAKIKLLSPVCTRVGEKIALSRRVEKHWRLIGWGEVSDGVTIELE